MVPFAGLVCETMLLVSVPPDAFNVMSFALSVVAEVIWIALGAGVLGGFANLAIRKTAPAPAHV